MRPLIANHLFIFLAVLILHLSTFVVALPKSPSVPNCQAPERVTVTVTVTPTGLPQQYPDWTHGSSLAGSGPNSVGTGFHPAPTAVGSCFDRKQHAFSYFYDHGFHFASMGGKPNGQVAKNSTAFWPAKSTSYPSNTKDSLSIISTTLSISSAASSSISFPYYNSSTTTTSSTSIDTSSTSTLTESTSLYSSNSTVPSTTSSTPVGSTTPTPSCEPQLQLSGVLENGFNKKNATFSISITNGCQFDAANTTAFANFAPITDLIVDSSTITVPGLTTDYALLSIFGLTTDGTAVLKSYQLHFGSVSMPILVQDTNGQPVSGVLVYGNATAYPGVSQICTTDSTGKCSLINLPSTTISLVATTSDNSIAVNGLAATSALVTLTLSPFVPPATNATYITDNGTTGWTGGTQSQAFRIKRDTTLVVGTDGQYDLQTASNSFSVHPFTKTVFIKYKFVTTEVPGGYFGTQYNDYYSVTIRSDTGTSVSVTNSMNALGLGAFDANGATDWFKLTLSVPANTKSVEYNIGVSNVADNLYDSEVVVDQVGDLQCDQCGDCDSCPTDPMCQDSCRNPPEKSCAFYRNCAEAQLGCGDSGYPIAYGDKNCNRFSNNLKWFTSSGQDFIWGTMHCLQTAMVPVLEACTATCSSFQQAAFDSHPACYVGNGFCSLQCPDVLAVIMTVNTDLVSLEGLKQAVQTAGGCVQGLIQTLQGCTGDVIFGAAAGTLAGTGIATGIALNVAIKYLSSVL